MSSSEKEITADSVIKCTACRRHLDHVEASVFRHPVLDVLICKKCFGFYEKGDWKRDEDGQDEFCRWCGEGGNLYICCDDACLKGFCRRCIKRNLGSKECSKVEEDDDWKCYLCDISQLKNLRQYADQVFRYMKQAEKEKNLSLKSRVEQLKSTLLSGDLENNLSLISDLKSQLESLERKVRENDIQSAVKLVESPTKVRSKVKASDDDSSDQSEGDNSASDKEFSPDDDVEDVKDSTEEKIKKSSKKHQNGASVKEKNGATDKKKNGASGKKETRKHAADIPEDNGEHESPFASSNEHSEPDRIEPIEIEDSDKDEKAGASNEKDEAPKQGKKADRKKSIEADRPKAKKKEPTEDDEIMKLLNEPKKRVLKQNGDASQSDSEPQPSTSNNKKTLIPERKRGRPRKKPISEEENDSDYKDEPMSAASSDNEILPTKTSVIISDEEIPTPAEEDDSDIEIIGEKKAKKKPAETKKGKLDAKTVFSSSDDSGDDDKTVKRKSIPAMPKTEEEKTKRKRKKSSGSESDSAKKSKTKRKRKKRVVDSDGGDDDDDAPELSPLVSDSGSDVEQEVAPRKKRKKKSKIEDSDNPDDDDEDGDKKGRRGVRKIISDDKVEKESRVAAKEEAERRRRVLERQKLYNEIEEAINKDIKDDKVTRCVLEYDAETKKPNVEVDEALACQMKPHQVEGVKFLYNTVIESVEQVAADKPGGGAILAHCMGLGKTFQSICFLHTILSHKKLNKYIKKVIVVCPCNVVLNWSREFEMWIEENQAVEGNIDVYEFSRVKTIEDRVEMLENWDETGGVLIIGYSMFRVMSQAKVKKKKLKERIPKLLHDPGADLVVCDEGHMLKSDKAQISKAMNLIRTRRRVILTGTPLQNNMSEYHCMVSFVKPNLLGTPKEFNNRFMNPITYGQEANASSHAVRLMKKRVHILNKLLGGCVHRCDYSHLTPYLPAKFEYILSINLGELQTKLYREYLKHIGITEDTTREDLKGRSLLKDYQILKMIWSHPYLLRESADRQEDRRQKEAYKNEIDDFVVDGSEEEFDSSKSQSSDNNDNSDEEEEDNVKKTYRTRRNRQENPKSESEEEVEKPKSVYQSTWWYPHIPEDDEEFQKLELSSKLTLALEILRDCELIGDKVILFSTSLLTLSLFEELLQLEYSRSLSQGDRPEGDYLNSWAHGMDYFRLDGSTSVDTRKKYIDAFNDSSNMRARLFLVSTKAGGIGTNMIGANRIIVLDASWNPSDDTQAIFRAYRYGQVKPVYVYRLLAHATMEEKIYDRQVNKISLASRVVDEQNLERHFNESDLKALYEFNPEKDGRKTPAVPKDRLLAEILMKHKVLFQGYHEHDSLLQKELEDELTEEERKLAWKEYEDERDGKTTMPPMYNMPGTAGFSGMYNPHGTVPPMYPNAYQQAYLQQQQQLQFMSMLQNMRQRFTQPQATPVSAHMTAEQREEALKKPPFFNFTINHPSLDPQAILNSIKLRMPNADMLAKAVYFRTELIQRRTAYMVAMQRSRQSIEMYTRQRMQPPKTCLDAYSEAESAVRLLDGLIPGLDETISKAKSSMSNQSRSRAGSSRQNEPVIDMNESLGDEDVKIVHEQPPTKPPPASSSSSSKTSGPIIEEIE